MKRLLLIPTLLFAAIPALAAAALDSTIRAVTVYNDRAIVTRSARAELHEGINELLIEGLPASLLDDSLQASGNGTATATILDISTREHFVAATPDPRRAALEEQLTSLREEKRSLSDRAALIKTQRDLIERLQNSAVSIASGVEKAERPKLAEVQETLAYGKAETEKLNAALQALDRELAVLEEQISAQQHQLDELPPVSPRRSVKTATLRVQASHAGDLDIELRYTTPHAGWRPSYDARVFTADNRVELGYYAQVRQSTGEDWENVALTLSTARPSLGGHAPKLSPWPLDLLAEESDSPPGIRPLARQAELLASPAPAAAQARMTFDLVSADYAEAQVDRSASVATFQVEAPATIPSDNSAKKISVTTLDLEAELAYRATPKRLPTAFLDASVRNTSDYPLLPGKMSVFVDHGFVASSRLEHTSPGDAFNLALGADEGIAITHKQTRRFTEQVGLMTRSTRNSYEYLITVKNNKAGPVHLIVSDQVPVSRNEKISVKVQAPAARDAKPDAEGLLEWALDLAPGETRELPLKFSIEYPQGLSVSGL
ncbi:mucoidy inhibitor MuiA family protein [Cephaloticoccus primus]|nr:mucoidy inhibitor MuiA family protein [Cephaloticoccus primus]